MFEKKRFLLVKLIAAIGLGFVSSALKAEQSIETISDPYYIGVGIGISFLQPETNSVALSLSQDGDFSYKIFGGYQFDDNWAAEFFWADMGDAEITAQSTGTLAGIVEYQSFGVGALYQYPIAESWDVFATAGVGRLRNSFQLVSAQRVEDSFIYGGLGVLWNVANTWDVRAEYDYYDTDAQMLSVNLVKRFGSASTKRIAHLENRVQQQEKLIADTAGAMSASAIVKQESCDDFLVVLDGVVFDKKSIALSDKTKNILNDVASKLLKLPDDVSFEVRAHTDDVGTELYNYSLSLARARNVRDYLSEQGVSLSRIKAQGYGEWRPKQSNATRTGRDNNRRAELVVIGVDKYVADTDTCPKLATPAISVPR